ncbi:hypothetical protein A2153_04980 [Candidatus Gottesmanbacteria bacterium RBG_16_38_7b]|uniref:Ribbon-helix-helix protein CopG domain-containing protein n=1 Tax=Candidatus Gottesmanbacteria bacterium RBG_16_38_7b TaxID=1798372 RepID=A0A1F5YGH5_9BACT|nr:MAG: hypothetical protein A2153_04980 [Candidatus Gottesmanbacteria bacterium RBG_16_38_7b]
MLIRTQILLEEKQKLELEELARKNELSISEIVRQSIPLVINKIKAKKKKTKKLTGADALLKWAKNAVHGPGDSEYDKYAYDL